MGILENGNYYLRFRVLGSGSRDSGLGVHFVKGLGLGIWGVGRRDTG